MVRGGERGLEITALRFKPVDLGVIRALHIFLSNGEDIENTSDRYFLSTPTLPKETIDARTPVLSHM